MKIQYDFIAAIVFIGGFAVQQALQILDPFVSAAVVGLEKKRASKDLPGGLSEPEFKKAVMSFLSLVIGIAVTTFAKISLLAYINETWRGSPSDILVTALVIGSGTEGTNTLLKYLGYVKDARKPELQPIIEVSIAPSSVSVQRSASFQFLGSIKNSENVGVVWSVPQGPNAGSITPLGLYTAPAAAGTYQVKAASAADPTRFAIATVAVP